MAGFSGCLSTVASCFTTAVPNIDLEANKLEQEQKAMLDSREFSLNTQSKPSSDFGNREMVKAAVHDEKISLTTRILDSVSGSRPVIKIAYVAAAVFTTALATQLGRYGFYWLTSGSSSTNPTQAAPTASDVEEGSGERGERNGRELTKMKHEWNDDSNLTHVANNIDTKNPQYYLYAYPDSAEVPHDRIAVHAIDVEE